MALVEGVKYGLSSHNNQCGNKAVIFVKLTDSALRAIDDYLKSQHKTGHRATLRFLGNEGNIHIPSSSNENGHSFDFSLSNNTDIEGPQGSFECIQQCGPRSLESAGPLSYKMRIKANDDVFVQTQHRFNELEHERQKECAKEIKSNCADIGRKVKKKIGMPTLPQRREKSPSYVGHQPPKPTSNFVAANSNSSLKLPNGYNVSSTNKNSNNTSNTRKAVNGAVNGNSTPQNGTGSNNSGSNNKNGTSAVGSKNQDISRRPLKERLIHMLAVKPYKKPELYQRLQSDGMKERDGKVFMTILQQIASFKDNEYSLLRGVWNDVQEDWPFYSEQERQLMKRRKPQNLTPPGSDSSVGSGTSSLSPRSNSSIGSGHSPSSYSHTSGYSKTVTGSSEINYKDLNTPEGNFDSSKGIKRPVSNGILTDNAEDYGDIPHKKTRVAHIKKPGSGSSSNGIGANANISNNSTTRADIVSKLEKDGFSGSSPQFSSHSNRIAERLSPIGTSGSNFSAQNGSNGTNGVVHNLNNHKSPRNGTLEPMEVSPPHQSVTSNGYHNGSQGEANGNLMEEPVSIGSSWQSRNGNDPHGFSDSEKVSRGDSDETDSVDSGNGSSTSGVSLGGSQQQIYCSSHLSNSNISGSHPTSNATGGYTNGTNATIKPSEKSEPISSSVPNIINNSSITNGCNRVSSTTNFHITPQSSPDSQVDMLHQKSMNSMPTATLKHNQRTNGKCNLDAAPNIEIIVTRDKSDSHRDSNRRRNDRDRGKDKERDGRSKDRIKRSDKKHLRVTDDRNGHEIENSDGSSVKLSSDYPSYLTKYTTITCPEQRSKYKEDFNAEYIEYRDLHAVIDTVSKRFAHLEERLRQEERGTDGYEKIKEQIVNEYYANKRNKKYQETRQKFQYLHEKLSHIKRLVADYDSHHQPEQETFKEYTNGFLRN